MAHHDNPGHVGIRTKGWKLIYYYGCKYDGSYQTPPAWELYDMRKDPHETVNQYDNPEFKEVVAKIREHRQEKKEAGEEVPPLGRPQRVALRQLRSKARYNPAAIDYLWGYALAAEGRSHEAIERLRKAESPGAALVSTSLPSVGPPRQFVTLVGPSKSPAHTSKTTPPSSVSAW